MAFKYPDMVIQLVSQLWSDILSLEPKNAELISGGISVVISILIYLVYRKQTRLAKLEQRPILHTNRYRIPSGVDSRQNPGVIIELRNHGNGSATGMTGRVSIKPVKISKVDTACGMMLFWFRNRIPRSASAWRRLTAQGNNQDDNNWNAIYGSKIGPGETQEYRVPFSINTNYSIWPDRLSWYWSKLIIWRGQDPHTFGFTSALSELTVDEDNLSDPALQPHYRLKVSIEHKNPAGYHSSEPVFDYIVPPFKNQTLEEALEAGRPYEEFKDNPAGYLDDVLVNNS